MTTQQVEARLTALEEELLQMKVLLQQNLLLKSPQSQSTQPWWEKISGTFPDDDAFDRAEQLGREWRNSYTDRFENS